MLTKDLLRTRLAGNYIKPRFISTDDPELRELADSILKICREGIGHTREYLENAAASCAALHKDAKLAKGIVKLALDRLTYETTSGDPRELRKKLFHESACAIREGKLPESPLDFRAALPSASGIPEGGLYADLPGNDKLLSIRDITSRELLERYNMSLVQTLLLFTEKLELEIPASEDPQLFRSFCGRLRFHRLLVSARRDGKTIRMVIDGPASLFENCTKYGLQTASFFPVVCRFSQWKAACTVKLKDQRRLILDESSGLVCRQTNLASWRPEEIRMFADLFRQENKDWTLDDEPGFLTLEGGKMIFPDFAFHPVRGGDTVFLELFHRWHASQLENRLDECRSGRIRNLLLGVDRSLLKKDGVLAGQLEGDGYFYSHGFFFRDFPGVKNVAALLESMKYSGKGI